MFNPHIVITRIGIQIKRICHRLTVRRSRVVHPRLMRGIDFAIGHLDIRDRNSCGRSFRGFRTRRRGRRALLGSVVCDCQFSLTKAKRRLSAVSRRSSSHPTKHHNISEEWELISPSDLLRRKGFEPAIAKEMGCGDHGEETELVGRCLRSEAIRGASG